MSRGVLVTGADAPLGERLVRTLLGDPNVSRVLAVGGRPMEEALPFQDERRLTYLSVDLTRERRVRELLFGPARDLGIEVVVHTSMGGSALERGKAVHRANVDATRDLLALCERHPTIRTFVLRSYGEVYQVQADLPVLIGEDHPINLSPNSPQYVRDRVEADLHACVRMGLSPLRILVLRCAEVLAPGTGSQLFDYLASPICLRPIGYDPMLNVLSVSDLVAALSKAVHAEEQGVFNIPGYDTLPLSACIRRWGRTAIPVPGAWMTPLYRWRRKLRGHDFSYGMNRRRFHYSGVLDGQRARDVLGYEAATPIDWPVRA
jgi:nucleoside-diphosphate-sugar epimerase